MRLHSDFKTLGYQFLLHFQTMKIPKVETRGISARVPHSTEFVVFLDYDNIKDGILMQQSLPFLQELFGLGDFYVFGTSEFGRHGVCVDRMTLREAVQVVMSSDCDAVFKWGIHINEYRTWILRTNPKGNRPKPKYLYSVRSPYNGKRLQSQAHAMFLQNYYGADVRLTNPDGNTILEQQDYKTSSKTDLKDVEKAH